MRLPWQHRGDRIKRLEDEVQKLQEQTEAQAAEVKELHRRLDVITKFGVPTAPPMPINTNFGLHRAHRVAVPDTPEPARAGGAVDQRVDADEALSIYSHASTAASQPACFHAGFRPQKLGVAAAMPYDKQSAIGLPPYLTSTAILGDEELGCLGVLGYGNLQQVIESVGQDLTPWLQLLTTEAGKTASTLPEGPKSRPTGAKPSTGEPDAGDNNDTTNKRLTRDQETVGADKPSPGSSKLLACVALMAVCKDDEYARVMVCQSGALPYILALMSSPSLAERRVAAHLLWYASRSPAVKEQLLMLSTPLDDASTGSATTSVGGTLIQFLAAHQEDVHAARAAALALNNLMAQDDQVRWQAVAEGGLSVLTSLLAASISVCQEAAAAALLGLTEKCDTREGSIVGQQLAKQPETLQVCLSALRYGDPGVQEGLAGMMQNVTMSLEGEALYQVMCSAPALLATLMETVRSGSSLAQEAAWASLGNIAAELRCHEALLVPGSQFIEMLALCLTEPLPIAPAALNPGSLPADEPHPMLTAALAAAQVQASAMLVLRNLCTGKPATKQAVIYRGGAAALLHATQSAGLAKALLGPAAGSASAVSGSVTRPMHPTLHQLLEQQVEELEEHEALMQSNALSALLSLSTDPGSREALVQGPAGTRTVPVLMGVLLGGAPAAKELAAKVVTNLSIPDANKEELVEEGAAVVLVTLVRTGSLVGKLAACKALQNLARAAANRYEIAACGGVTALLDVISEHDGVLFDAAAAALHGICNQMQVLEDVVDAGGPRVLLHALRMHHGLSTRGVKLLGRLLHRMCMLFPGVQQEVSAEVSALGLI